MPFQTQVNISPSPAVEGDFASTNPKASVLPANGILLSDGTATVGRFAWVNNVANTVGSAGATAPDGFIHRDHQALIDSLSAEATMVIPAGLITTVHNQGDFWAKTTTAATVGQKVFASTTTGAIATGAAGATIAGAIETKWKVASAGAVGELIKITSWA